MIYNKSTHPIEVKKISIRLWTLRDEIEAAIGRRMKECEAAGVPLHIDDIKQFYNLNMEAPLTEQSNVLQLNAKKEDGVTSLMESLGEEVKEESGETFSQAEEIMAEQAAQGLDSESDAELLKSPYQRQAPDLDKISYGFALLSDINMDTILSFTKNKFLQGQSVVVEFLIPQPFMMMAEVSYCHHYGMRSKIISETRPDYRLQCRFTYAMPGERELLRNFLRSIEPTIPETKKKPSKDAEEDSLGI